MPLVNDVLEIRCVPFSDLRDIRVQPGGPAPVTEPASGFDQPLAIPSGIGRPVPRPNITKICIQPIGVQPNIDSTCLANEKDSRHNATHGSERIRGNNLLALWRVIDISNLEELLML